MADSSGICRSIKVPVYLGEEIVCLYKPMGSQ